MDTTPVSLHICGAVVEVQEVVMPHAKEVQAQAAVMFEQTSQLRPVTLLKSQWEPEVPVV
jgi:hypothetical protein